MSSANRNHESSVSFFDDYSAPPTTGPPPTASAGTGTGAMDTATVATITEVSSQGSSSRHDNLHTARSTPNNNNNNNTQEHSPAHSPTNSPIQTASSHSRVRNVASPALPRIPRRKASNHVSSFETAMSAAATNNNSFNSMPTRSASPPPQRPTRSTSPISLPGSARKPGAPPPRSLVEKGDDGSDSDIFLDEPPRNGNKNNNNNNENNNDKSVVADDDTTHDDDQTYTTVGTNGKHTAVRDSVNMIQKLMNDSKSKLNAKNAMNNSRNNFNNSKNSIRKNNNSSGKISNSSGKISNSNHNSSGKISPNGEGEVPALIPMKHKNSKDSSKGSSNNNNSNKRHPLTLSESEDENDDDDSTTVNTHHRSNDADSAYYASGRANDAGTVVSLTRSLGGNNTNKSAHRSREQFDNKDFLHSSVLVAAKMEKKLRQKQYKKVPLALLGVGDTSHSTLRSSITKKKSVDSKDTNDNASTDGVSRDGMSTVDGGGGDKSDDDKSDDDDKSKSGKSDDDKSDDDDDGSKTSKKDSDDDSDDDDEHGKKESFRDESEGNGDLESFAEDDRSCFWDCFGAIFLCVLLLGVWGGVIPYCIYRYRYEIVPTLGETPAPTAELLPWTNAPTFTPETRAPSAAPTPISQNQELLNLLQGNPFASNTNSTTENNTTSSPSSDSGNATLNNQTQGSATESPSDEATLAATDSPTSMAPTITITQSPTVPGATRPPSLAPTTASPTTMSPTTNVTSSTGSANFTLDPNEEEPDVVFPNYTLLAFEDRSSPQSQAFSWMLRDPNFGSYSASRMRQRYALATLYYSTNGDDWIIQQQQQPQPLRLRQRRRQQELLQPQPLDQQPQQQTWGQSDIDVGDSQLTRGGFLPWLSYGHECDWYFQTKTAEVVSAGANSMLQRYSSNPTGTVVCEDETDPVGRTFRSYRSLYLERANLQGNLPPEMAMLTGLRTVQLNDNLLFGTLPGNWFWDDKETDRSWQTTLTEINLQNNTLTGGIPSDIGLAANLTKLNFQENRFSNSIPTEIGKLTNLYEMLWNDNFLTGKIPQEIGLASALKVISWNANQLSGTLPTQLMMCQSLQDVNIGENRLTGSIPWQFGMLRGTLKELQLHSNQLSQSLPTNLGFLNKLSWLNLGNNRLVGPVPTEFGSMTALKLLQLEVNQLQGAFPSDALSKLTSISRAWVNGNPGLKGAIPLAWCGSNDTLTAVSYVDIRVDCETLTCPCADGCTCSL